MRFCAGRRALLAALTLFPLALLAGCGQKSSPGGGAAPSASPGSVTLLNVSYDPTRELCQEYNQAFARHWQGQAGQAVTIKQSHGGSGKQAQSVLSGLPADVVTLGIASDVDALQQHGLINAGWQQRLPNNSAPYTSTVVFLVRKGNPKGIHDWPDLIKPGVSVITPDPKASSGGRWSYLAAWGQALTAPGGSETAARAYVQSLYRNVPILDSGARGATNTFVQRGVGDVLLAWENEAYLAVNHLGKGQYEIVYPSKSIRAEPPVAVVDKNVDAHHTRAVAEEYLKYLYSPEGQEIVAKHYYRPTDPAVAKKYAAQFSPVTLFTFEKTFGSWDAVQQQHFAPGGIFDQIYRK